jgi:hypothetical protein
LKGGEKMENEILRENDIYLQDVVCSTVAENLDKSDFDIYNMVSSQVDIFDLETTVKVLDLIKINKLAFQI